MWSLTFMVDGTKRVERIPEAWVTRLRSLVQGGRAYKEAVSEVLSLNARLLALWRREQEGRQQRQVRKRRATKKAKTSQKSRRRKRR
jgi:hypothetical protein